mmetsp:Transcript_24864/g.98729  ORF Transcript_24864/g.98729 Transcript_24864/m.98729 type:complete len:815 (-) Transcript_24864:196-2640(-)
MIAAHGAYVAAYACAWAELAAYRRKSRSLDAFVRCAELQPANAQSRDMQSLVIMPVQRGMRYPMLVAELRKRMDAAGFSYTYHPRDRGGDGSCEPAARDHPLDRALASAKRAASAIDAETQTEKRRRKSLLRVARAFKSSSEQPATKDATKGSGSDAVARWRSPACRLAVVKDGVLSRTAKKAVVEAYFVLFDAALAYGDASASASSSTFHGAKGLNNILGGGSSPQLVPSGGKTLSTHHTNGASTSNTGAAAAAKHADDAATSGAARATYALKDAAAVETCYAAPGDDRLGGLQRGGHALDPWEFLLVVVPAAPTEAVATLVVSAPTPTAASEWVAAINGAAARRRHALGIREPARPDQMVAAYVARQSKVAAAEFELLPHATGAHYVARPAPTRARRPGTSPGSGSASSGIPMPHSTATRTPDRVFETLATVPRPPAVAAPPPAAAPQDDVDDDHLVTRRSSSSSVGAPPPPPPLRVESSSPRSSSASAGAAGLAPAGTTESPSGTTTASGARTPWNGANVFPPGSTEHPPSGLGSASDGSPNVAGGETVRVRLDAAVGLGLELHNVDGRVVVFSIADPSPARDAGVQYGDAVLRVDGRLVGSTDDVVVAVDAARAARRDVALVLVRADHTVNVDVPRPDRAPSASRNDDDDATTLLFPDDAAAAAAATPSLRSSSPATTTAREEAPRFEAAAPGSPGPPAPRDPHGGMRVPADVEAASILLGFTPGDIARAYAAGATNVDAIANWILDHGDDDAAPALPPDLLEHTDVMYGDADPTVLRAAAASFGDGAAGGAEPHRTAPPPTPFADNPFR